MTEQLPIDIEGYGKVFVEADSFLALDRDGQSRVIQDIIRQMPKPPTALSAFGTGASDMAFLGASDEGLAAATAATGGDFNAELKRQRTIKDQAQQSHPWAYMGGQVAGGLVTAPLTLARGAGQAARAAPTVAGKVGQIVKDTAVPTMEGMIGGGIYGIGSGEGSIEERMPNAVPGMIGGGAGGAVGYNVGKAVTGALGRADEGVRRAFNPMGADDRVAAGRVASHLQTSTGSPDAVEAAIANVRPNRPLAAQNESLGDLLGVEYRGLPGPGRQTASTSVDSLIAKTKRDVGVAAQGRMGGDDNPYRWLNNHILKSKSRAKKAYDEVWKNGETSAGDVQGMAEFIVQDDVSGRILAGARRLEPDLAKFKDGQFKRPLSVREAEALRRSADQEATAAYKKGRGGFGERYADAAGRLRDALDANHADLAAVRRQYSDDKSIKEAFDTGRKALTTPVGQVEVDIANMGNADLAAWKKGVWAGIQHSLGGSDDSIRMTKRLTESENGRTLLRMATGRNVDEINRAIDDFAAAVQLKTKMKGNSLTAQRMQDDAAPMGDVGEALLDAITTGGIGTIGRAAVKGAGNAMSSTKRLTPNQQQRVIDLMLSTNPAEVESALRAYRSGNVANRAKAATYLRNAFTRAAQAAGIAMMTPQLREDASLR